MLPADGVAAADGRSRRDSARLQPTDGAPLVAPGPAGPAGEGAGLELEVGAWSSPADGAAAGGLAGRAALCADPAGMSTHPGPGALKTNTHGRILEDF